MGSRVQPIPREALRSFAKAIECGGSWLLDDKKLNSGRSLLDAVIDPNHWLHDDLVPSSDGLKRQLSLLGSGLQERNDDVPLEGRAGINGDQIHGSSNLLLDGIRIIAHKPFLLTSNRTSN